MDTEASRPGSSALLDNLVLFVRLLRRAGLPVSTGQTLELTRALGLVDMGSRDQVYHASRAVLVSRREDLPVFELVFNRFWSAATGTTTPAPRTMPRAPRHDAGGQGRFTIATYMAFKARQSDPEVDVADRSATYSPTELLHRKPFSEMTPEELERVKRLLGEVRWTVARRRTRRRVAHRRGEYLDLRASLRHAAKHAGVPVRLPRRRRKWKNRPVVLIADISGSMEKYARLVLQFFYAVKRSLPLVECFVFGTRLTRITTQLESRNIDRALEEASREVVDWGGGTRIGESLDTFCRVWSRRVLKRGAVVVIVSDGCDRGEVDMLRRALRHIQHRCHRLIWLNPHLGQREYEPLVEGMAAALDYIDEFLPVHDLQSLETLATTLAEIPPARRGAGKPEPGRSR